MEMILIGVAEWGPVKRLTSLLRSNRSVDINQPDRDGWTELHHAVYSSPLEDVKVLLAFPGITVNARTNTGSTPFAISCLKGRVPVVQLFLKDSRVDVTLADDSGCTPLWMSSYFGILEVVEWLIASGRDLGDLNKKGKEKWGEGKKYSTFEIARNYPEVLSLLERFQANPMQTRHEVRLKLGLQDELAAELFAVIVFLCDELLRLKPVASPSSSKPSSSTAAAAAAAIRFFVIAQRLPMELQMILCYRVVGSMRQNLKSNASEEAFKSLAKILLCKIE